MRIVYGLLLALLAPTWASSGDQDDSYIRCVQLCKIQNCGTSSTYTIPLTLQLTRWTCEEDCNYGCMHQITEKHIRTGQPIEQYHGKWPFWRFLGAQEPASVVFSLLNLVLHWKGGLKLRRRIPDSHPMKKYYLRWSLLSMNMWIWSSVFHIRDRPLTEKLDYFSAALGIMYALYYGTLRIFHLYPAAGTKLTPTIRPPPKNLQRRIVATICTLAYIGHITYLSLIPRFDYSYNIVFNAAFGFMNNLLWMIYSLPSSLSFIHRFPFKSKSYRPSFVSKAGLLMLLMTVASALELFDFPPWFGVVDAHSLWHLSTAPIAYLWYGFTIEDSLDPSWREQRS